MIRAQHPGHGRDVAEIEQALGRLVVRGDEGLLVAAPQDPDDGPDQVSSNGAQACSVVLAHEAAVDQLTGIGLALQRTGGDDAIAGLPAPDGVELDEGPALQVGAIGGDAGEVQVPAMRQVPQGHAEGTRGRRLQGGDAGQQGLFPMQPLDLPDAEAAKDRQGEGREQGQDDREAGFGGGAVHDLRTRRA